MADTKKDTFTVLRERLTAQGWRCGRARASHPLFGQVPLLKAMVLARKGRAIEALSAAGLVHASAGAAQC